MKNIPQVLKQLGLSSNEIQAYLYLLRFGSSPASTLARRLQINRSTMRYTLENLAKKRFTFQENRKGTFFFSAEDPDKILLILHAEQKAVQHKQKAVEHIIGDLKKIQNPHAHIPKIRVFEGVDGLIKMYEDLFQESKKKFCNIYGFTNLHRENFYPGVWDYIKNTYIPTRQKIGNQAYMLFNPNPDNNTYREQDNVMNRISLIIPTKKFPVQTCFHIYGNKVAFYSRQKDSSPVGTIIEHKQIRDDQLTLFRLAWNYARTLPINEKYHDKKI